MLIECYKRLWNQGLNLLFYLKILCKQFKKLDFFIFEIILLLKLNTIIKYTHKNLLIYWIIKISCTTVLNFFYYTMLDAVC
jgi:hypothetical protein